MSTSLLHPDYPAFLTALKTRILHARTTAARVVNHELILLYWDIGRGIVEKQRLLGWGESVIDQVSSDLLTAFPKSSGFSPRNLRDMKRFYLAYSDETIWRQAAAKSLSGTKESKSSIWPQAVAKLPDGQISPFLKQPVAEINVEPKWPQAVAKSSGNQTAAFLPQLVAEIPWGHHRFILDKVTEPAARIYYLRATAQLGWSRSVLLNQIKAGTYERAVKEKKTHNFAIALPEHFAEQAGEMLKSSYNLEFLGLAQAMKERELEDRLISRLQQFILELGYGFCFVGRQYRLALGRKEYFVDLLFYHRFLKTLVAFDLKVDAFKPEYAGKMDFYLNLLNEKERAPDDQPSIGIILCAEKDDIEVEFALKSKTNPIGVAEYQLQSKLPAQFKGRLPSAKQLADAVRQAKVAG
ncbi:MAG TPA: PDDEXK nuclease domain-containing protein [Verrucomicrobiae bacterium]|nr:PDDEXK nuclease domain-containing protein [Verrucomicrobiae bacterium]